MKVQRRHFAATLPWLMAFTLTISLALWQYITVLPSITTSHPYSDVLHYLELVERQQFFGPTHFTWRFLFPGFITALYTVLPISVAAMWTGLNVLLFSVILWNSYRSSRKLLKAEHHLLLGTLALVMLHPAFWRGAFLPMLEIPLFFAIWLMLTIHKKIPVHPVLFTLLIFLSLWIKEIFLLSWLFGFILYKDDLSHRKTWISWHLPFLISGGLYALILAGFSGETAAQNNYLLAPSRWLTDWSSLFATEPATILKSFLASTGLLWISLPVIKLLFHVRTFRHFLYITLVMSLLWFILSLFTVTNAPRLIWPFYAILLTTLPQK